MVWFDAHGDLNTMETTTSGFLGGLPYAVALGLDLDDWRLAAGLEPPVRSEAAVLIGASDLDASEVELLQKYRMLHITAKEMMQPGVGERVQTDLQAREGEATAWYLHMDLDVGGPEESPGGFTPAPHWPPRERILEAVKATVQTLPVKVASLAVYNPGADTDGRGVRFGLDVAMALVG